MDTLYLQKKAYMVMMFLILIGAVNWLAIGAFGVNFVRQLLPYKYARILYAVLGGSALVLLFTRDIYLPFLGETLVPGAALQQKTPANANQDVMLQTKPGAKVLYWTTEPNPVAGGQLATWKEAYGGYENSGVAVADANGKAVLRFRGPPQPYRVPFKGRLDSHVHFRICDEHGFMGPVQLRNLETGAIESFRNML
jgi:uncharacterized membrane protein YuzA (DUF378 family)